MKVRINNIAFTVYPFEVKARLFSNFSNSFVSQENPQEEHAHSHPLSMIHSSKARPRDRLRPSECQCPCFISLRFLCSSSIPSSLNTKAPIKPSKMGTYVLSSIMEHPDALECFDVIDTIARHRLETRGEDPPLNFSVTRPKTPQALEQVVRLLNQSLRKEVMYLARWQVFFRPEENHPFLTLFAVLAFMQLGVILEWKDIALIKGICPRLQSPYHQVQVWTAANEYKNNGVRWVFEGLSEPVNDLSHPLNNGASWGLGVG